MNSDDPSWGVEKGFFDASSSLVVHVTNGSRHNIDLTASLRPKCRAKWKMQPNVGANMSLEKVQEPSEPDVETSQKRPDLAASSTSGSSRVIYNGEGDVIPL